MVQVKLVTFACAMWFFLCLHIEKVDMGSAIQIQEEKKITPFLETFLVTALHSHKSTNSNIYHNSHP